LKAAGSTSSHSGAGTLVLIALKARNGLAIGREAITPTQQKRIATTARAWLARPPDPMALTQRFDAVFLAPVH
jgi:putative endonuclease